MKMTGRSDFDRSFDFFATQTQHRKVGGSNAGTSTVSSTGSSSGEIVPGLWADKAWGDSKTDDRINSNHHHAPVTNDKGKKKDTTNPRAKNKKKIDDDPFVFDTTTSTSADNFFDFDFAATGDDGFPLVATFEAEKDDDDDTKNMNELFGSAFPDDPFAAFSKTLIINSETKKEPTPIIGDTHKTSPTSRTEGQQVVKTSSHHVKGNNPKNQNPEDVVASQPPPPPPPPPPPAQPVEDVTIAVQEQLSAMYDAVSKEPTCQVDGTVYIKANTTAVPAATGSSNKKTNHNLPFCITLRDLMGELETLEVQESFCQDISDKVSRQTLHRSDRVLRILRERLAAQQSSTDPIGVVEKAPRILNYTCSPTLRPVPLLVKSRVQVSQRHCRAGFKIRANPSNEYPLANMVIIVAVPPHVRGDTVKMSLPGGKWSEMKRTISWSVESLTPGEALEVQLQFESILEGSSDGNNGGGVTGGGSSSSSGALDAQNNKPAPKFPVLVRADSPSLFSSIEFKSDYSDGMSAPVKLNLQVSGRVLHRKVS